MEKKFYVYVILAIITMTALAVFLNTVDEINNNVTLVAEIAVGIVITTIVYGTTKENEKRQKIFLGNLEKTRNNRINFYATKLVVDLEKIKNYFEVLENLPKKEFEKLNVPFYEKFKMTHVITLNLDGQQKEVPNFLYFNVMKKDLQIIESDLPPEISYFVGGNIEMSEMCLIPMYGKIHMHDKLWNQTKDNVIIAIERLNSTITEKKSLKEYGVVFTQINADTKI
ncbi:hypothetical protein C5F49_05170 [Nitrosopumilus oxyclinae]|uniref:Uncharacterized protein n=1 Tax=Nitrosopumilus oxyclinae TaxID=1959104 RepID=A0A7D5M309_9ARCH|nr:hypothetical protein [Nitrosopumilus oxyclinae]QLH04771.1 hypothetical protein C5F49_05170 [Nitrosopumilus oxyclinae]